MLGLGDRLRRFAWGLVIALIAAGFPSSASGSSSQVPTLSPPSQMAPPQPFNPTTFSMSLFMTPPSSDGGSSIEEYQFTAYPGGITHNIFTNQLEEWWVPNLAPGTAYSFTVRARNAMGWSTESSRSVTMSTLALPTPPPPPPAPTIELVPIPSTLEIGCAISGQAFSAILRGQRLTGITSASVNGVALGISEASDDSVRLSFPALAAGRYNMVYGSNFGTVTHIGALRVCDPISRPRTSSPTISASISPSVSPSISNSVSPTTSGEAVSELVRSDTNVFFAPDSSRLTAAARSALENLADSHLDARSGYFVVEGFSVRSANLGYARALAWRRAQVVADYLRSIGVRAFFRVTARVVDSADSGFRRVEVSATSRQ